MKANSQVIRLTNPKALVIVYILLGLAIQLDPGCKLNNYQCMYHKHYCNHLKGVLITGWAQAKFTKFSIHVHKKRL